MRGPGSRTSLRPGRGDVRRTRGALPASRAGGDGISSPGFSFPQLSGVSLTPAAWKINSTCPPPWGTLWGESLLPEHRTLGQQLHKNIPQRGRGPGPCPCSSPLWGPMMLTRTPRKAAAGLGGPGAADRGGRGSSRGPQGGADPVSHFFLVPEARSTRPGFTGVKSHRGGMCRRHHAAPQGREQGRPGRAADGAGTRGLELSVCPLPYAPEARVLGPLWSAGGRQILSLHGSSLVTSCSGAQTWA